MKTETETHRKRTPFSANRTRLQVDEKIPGYVLRWFNDQDDRLIRAENAGYEFVLKKDIRQVGDKDVSQTQDLGSRVGKVVGRTHAGTPIWAFLMKIPQAFYDEDKAAKEKVNARIDEAIRAGKAGGADVQNKYGDVTLKDNA